MYDCACLINGIVPFEIVNGNNDLQLQKTASNTLNKQSTVGASKSGEFADAGNFYGSSSRITCTSGHGNGPSVSIKGKEILDQVFGSNFLKQDTDQRSKSQVSPMHATKAYGKAEE